MSKRPAKTKTYEVYSPMPYCEVYIVPATSKKEARRLFEESKGTYKFECIGEVPSRRKIVREVKP